MAPVPIGPVGTTDDGSPRVCQDLAPVIESLTRQPHGLTEHDTELVSTSLFVSAVQVISVRCCLSVLPTREAEKR
jgi:hypothetical protein